SDMEKLLATVENPKDLIQLDRFDRSNFTRWKDKVIFLLTALKFFYVLGALLAALPESTPEDTNAIKAERKKREEDELLC
ncbi:hypothetical protein A4A49_62186, partial [Nicotiana attenuata]